MEENQEVTEPDVIAMNVGAGLALLDNDEVISITNLMYDDDLELRAAVAGPCSNGKWYSIDTSQFVTSVVH